MITEERAEVELALRRCVAGHGFSPEYAVKALDTLRVADRRLLEAEEADTPVRLQEVLELDERVRVVEEERDKLRAVLPLVRAALVLLDELGQEGRSEACRLDTALFMLGPLGRES